MSDVCHSCPRSVTAPARPTARSRVGLRRAVRLPAGETDVRGSAQAQGVVVPQQHQHLAEDAGAVSAEAAVEVEGGGGIGPLRERLAVETAAERAQQTAGAVVVALPEQGRSLTGQAVGVGGPGPVVGDDDPARGGSAVLGVPAGKTVDGAVGPVDCGHRVLLVCDVRMRGPRALRRGQSRPARLAASRAWTGEAGGAVTAPASKRESGGRPEPCPSPRPTPSHRGCSAAGSHEGVARPGAAGPVRARAGPSPARPPRPPRPSAPARPGIMSAERIAAASINARYAPRPWT